MSILKLLGMALLWVLGTLYQRLPFNPLEKIPIKHLPPIDKDSY